MAQETGLDIHQRTMGEHSLPGYGPVVFAKRPVRSRMQGVVGRDGEKPSLTRLAFQSLPALEEYDDTVSVRVKRFFQQRVLV